MRRVAVVLLAGCGAAAPPKRLPSNQVLAPMAEPVAAADGRVWLWCSVPGGEQCRLAKDTLRVPVSEAAELPGALFTDATWRDLDDDCVDPEMQGLKARLGAALGVPEDSWVDQLGELTLERIDVPVHGGGCTNATLPGVPDVKIQFSLTQQRTVAVVRVWELP